MGIPMGLHESVISSMSSAELAGRQPEEESVLESYHESVLEVLRYRAGEELKASQVHDALESELPEASVAIVLSELVHRGLVSRRSKPGQGRRRATNYFRALGPSSPEP